MTNEITTQSPRRNKKSPSKRGRSTSRRKSRSPRKRSPTKSTPKKKVPFIGKISEAPVYMRFNPYILTGYRINFTTPLRAAKSILMIHNESCNVWSHLIGALYFLFMLVYVLMYMQPPSVEHNDYSMLRWFESHD